MASSVNYMRRGSSLAVAAGYAGAFLLCGIFFVALPTSSFAPVSRRSASGRHWNDRVEAVGGSESTTSLSYRMGNNEDVVVGKDTLRSPLVWTSWDVALNIGREAGTMMPDSWGASGARLLLRTQIQFRPYKLYHRLSEDKDQDGFLGGEAEEAHICHVVGGGVQLGPSVTESGRKIFAENGGWRIARGEGPRGSDELRFFVELGRQAEKGDVICPAGRLYCACGYFGVSEQGRSKKADAQDVLDSLDGRYDGLLDEANRQDPLSIRRMEIWMDMMKCQVDIERVNRELDYLQTEEPDLGLLSLSQDGDIGLTRTGGVSYKVQSGPFGLGSAYHIIGRMELKSCKDGNHKRP